MRYLKILALTVLVPLGCSKGVEGFPQVSVLIDGDPVEVRLAATPETRARGFQHASPGQIRSERILFTWPEESEPVFHMDNLAAPLKIAWIADGEVIALERMTPGRGQYRPPEPVDAALELAPEEAEQLGIESGSMVRVRRVGCVPQDCRYRCPVALCANLLPSLQQGSKGVGTLYIDRRGTRLEVANKALFSRWEVHAGLHRRWQRRAAQALAAECVYLGTPAIAENGDVHGA